MQLVGVNYKIKDKDIISPKFIIGIVFLWGVYGFAFDYFSYKAGVIGTLIVTVFFLLSNNMKKYLIILSALPFAAIFKVNPKTPSSILILYIIYILDKFIDRKKFKLTDIIPLLILMSIQILSVSIYDASTTSIISFFVNIIFAWVCMVEFESVQDKQLLFKYSGLVFSISVVLNIIIADYFPNIPYVVSYDKQIALDLIGRFSALNGDPNYYNQLVLMAIGLLLPLSLKLIKEKKYGKSILIIAIEVFLIKNGLRSLSKSYVITLVILIVLVGYFLIIKGSKKKINFVLAPMIMTLAIAGVIITINQLVIPIIEQRANTAGLLTNRDIIWKLYFELFKKFPLITVIGSGFSNGMNVLARYFGSNYVAHNVYIESIADLGLLGIALLLTFWSRVLKYFKFLFKSEKSLYLWVFLITSFGLSLSSFDALYVMLPIIILIETDK